MKTLITFAMVLSINLYSYAAPVNELLSKNSGVSYSYQKVKVTLLNGIGKVKISVHDENGMSLFTDFIKVKESVVYPINMADVPAGKYLVRISNKMESTEHWVDIKPKKVTTHKVDAAIKTINDEQIKLMVRFQDENMTLKMYSNSHRLLLKENIKGNKSFSKKYNLQNLTADKVYFTLTDNKGNLQYIYQ